MHARIGLAQGKSLVLGSWGQRWGYSGAERECCTHVGLNDRAAVVAGGAGGIQAIGAPTLPVAKSVDVVREHVDLAPACRHVSSRPEQVELRGERGGNRFRYVDAGLNAAWADRKGGLDAWQRTWPSLLTSKSQTRADVSAVEKPPTEAGCFL